MQRALTVREGQVKADGGRLDGLHVPQPWHRERSVNRDRNAQTKICDLAVDEVGNRLRLGRTTCQQYPDGEGCDQVSGHQIRLMALASGRMIVSSHELSLLCAGRMAARRGCGAQPAIVAEPGGR